MSTGWLQSSPFRLAAGTTVLALAGQVLLAVPSWAAASVSLATVDLTGAAASSGGAFSVSGPTAADDILITGDVTLSGAAPAGRVVTVRGGTAALPRQITLQNATISAGADLSGALQLEPGAYARITLVGASALTGSGAFPGLGIPVNSGAVVAAASLSSTLNVTGSGNAAAIGGDGNAVLTEPAIAPVTLSGVAGASCGAFTVAGGTVNATVSGQADTGAAIGGGRFGDGCSVTVTGGVVNAKASAAAGIGGGIGKDGANGYSKDSPGGSGGTVQISGGTVSATSAGVSLAGESSLRYSAAIGGGRGGGGGAETQGTDGLPGSLSITGGTVRLSPKQSGMAPSPSVSGQLLGLVKVNNVPAVSQVVVTPDGGSPTQFNVPTNHPADDTIYLYLPFPKRYSIAVTTAADTKTYTANLTPTGAEVNAVLSTSPSPSPSPSAGPAALAMVAPVFDAVQWGYAPPVAKPLVISNTGGTAASVSGVTVSTASFTVAKPAVVNVPAGGVSSVVTVQPKGGLGVGVHQAMVTVLYDLGKSVTVPVSFTVTGTPNLRLTAPAFPAVTFGAAAPAAKELVITNTGTAPASLTGVRSSKPGSFQVTSSTATLPPNGVVRVAVRAAAKLPVGTHSATIFVDYAGRTVSATVSLVVKAPPVVAVKAGQTTLTLVKGSSVSIPAFGYQGDGKAVKVAWASSKKSVATVSSTGSIKGVKAGTAKITATAGGKKVTISVKVLAKKSKTKMKKVSATVPKTMKVGARAYVKPKLSPTTVPKAKVKYSSSKKAVVSVDTAGTLTAKKKGKASITIKAGGKSKKYTITVK